MSEERTSKESTKTIGQAATLRSFDLGLNFRKKNRLQTGSAVSSIDGQTGSSGDFSATDPILLQQQPKRKSAAFENRGDLVQCPQCPEVLRGQLRLLEHICEAHQSADFDLIGQDSEEPIGIIHISRSVRYSASNHGARGNGREKVFCPICNKQTSSQSALTSHLQHAHADVKPFSCGICGKEFRKKSNLKSHTMTHAIEKECECKICGKEFSSRRTLKVHLRIHTGERPFQCKFCERSFIQRVHLMRHVAWHIRQGGASRVEGDTSATTHQSSETFNSEEFFTPLPIEQQNESEFSTGEESEPGHEIKIEPITAEFLDHQPMELFPGRNLNSTSRQPTPPSSIGTSTSTAAITTSVTSIPEPKNDHQQTCSGSSRVGASGSGTTGTGSGSNCANCELMRGELDLLKVEFGILKQLLSGKLTLMEQKVDGMKEMLNLN